MQVRLHFHQAIFGYDSGHHLLESSMPLSTELKHMLAVATDLSGSAPPFGFETSITGMPLPGTRSYALFRTWLAPEMPRPGSVWSQVIFIEQDQFSKIDDFNVIKRAFRKPSKESSLSDYRDLVEVCLDGEENSFSILAKSTLVEKLVESLYTRPNASVVLLTSDEQMAESLVFSIWSQQWPRLRRVFRFSTGSFSDRGGGGPSFDLQVSPISNRRVWQKEGHFEIIDHLELPPRRVEDWVKTASEDLVYPDKSGLRNFFRSFGSDLKSPRSGFSKLVELHDMIRLSVAAEWSQIMEKVGRWFPSSSDALKIKKMLCNPSNEETDQKARSVSSASFLLFSESASAYEAVSNDLRGLIQSLWTYRKDDTLDLISRVVRELPRQTAINFSRELAMLITPSELELISSQWSELVPFLVSQNPNLAITETLWAMPSQIQSRAYEVLESLDLPPKTWGDIVAQMRPETTAISPRNLVRSAGRFAIEGAFDWIERNSIESSRWMPTQQWKEALEESASGLLLSSTRLSVLRVAFCAWLISPEKARQILRSSREDIQQLADSPLDSLPVWLRTHTAFLLVALGLGSSDGSGVKCIIRGFFRVYEALASSDYSYESWLLLSPELPNLGWWGEWDRCKKLRRAVRNMPKDVAASVSAELLKVARTEEQQILARKVAP